MRFEISLSDKNSVAGREPTTTVESAGHVEAAAYGADHFVGTDAGVNADSRLFVTDSDVPPNITKIDIDALLHWLKNRPEGKALVQADARFQVLIPKLETILSRTPAATR